MPQHPALAARRLFSCLLFLLALLTLIAGCGGNSSSSSQVSTISIGFTDATAVFNTLTTQSLQQGQTLQLATQIQNSKAVALFPPVTWSSSNSQIASVSTNGALCGGTWDANFVNCTPGQTGAATITAAAGGKAATITISVHSRISKVVLTPAPSPNGCSSQTQTLQFTATSLDSAGNPVTSPGPTNFSTADATIATVDVNGLVTAINSGATGVFASVAGIISAPATFVTCPPMTILLHKSSDPIGTPTTNFNVAIGSSIPLVADVTDTLGNPIIGLPLTLSSSQPAGVSVSGTTLTASDNTFATVIASCLPPGCNPSGGTNAPGTGFASYSNMVTVTVTGTALKTTAYVTGITAADGTNTNTSLLPIDTSANTAGTSITLPAVPNSIAISPKGDTLYVGTASGLAVIATAANTLSPTVSNAPGSILAVSPSGTQVVLNDAANTRALLYDSTASTVTPLETGLAPQSASFSPDGYKLFLSANGKVFEYTSSTGVTHQTPFTANVTSITVIPQAVLAYASPTAPGQLSSIATCNNTVISNPTVTAAPSLLQAAANGTELIGIGASWFTLPYAIGSTVCPPTVTDPGGSATAPAYSGPVPTQLTVSPTNNYAVVTSNNTPPVSALNLLNLQNGTPIAAALAVGTGTLTTAATTLDGTKLYVGLKGGAAGNAVHLFDLTQPTPADTAQITTTFTPDFVVVRP
ncbi:MAG: Ig-like domain-containing protein [Acidobacteriaceae bacterium]